VGQVGAIINRPKTDGACINLYVNNEDMF